MTISLFFHFIFLTISVIAFFVYFTNKDRVTVLLLFKVGIVAVGSVLVFALVYSENEVFQQSSFLTSLILSYENFVNPVIPKQFIDLKNAGLLIVFVQKLYALLLITFVINIIVERIKTGSNV